MAKIIGFYNMSNFYKEHCMCCGKKTAKKRLSFDKAGGYGIQDSFGTINIIHIEGSFTNVIGLPVAQVFEKINEIVNQNQMIL